MTPAGYAAAALTLAGAWWLFRRAPLATLAAVAALGGAYDHGLVQLPAFMTDNAAETAEDLDTWQQQRLRELRCGAHAVAASEGRQSIEAADRACRR